MADSSLDDFFAKKDKNKKKTKTKPGATGDVDEGSTKLSKKVKKKKDKEIQNQSSATVNMSHPQEDEEWKDFEEEKQADYSGLRIQTLQISKEEQDREGADGGDHADGDDENKDRRDGALGPWNKSGATISAASTHTSHSEPTKEEATPKAPAKYIPPAQRQGAASTPSSAHLPSARKKKEAPNVHSEEDFPTLGGPGSGKGSSQQYSSTSSSDLIDSPNQRRGINLTLENKFSALQD